MTLDIHNWSSSAHQELLKSAHQEVYKIVKDEIFPNVNQVDARVQNFEIQFLKEAAKFVRDFQSLANEADESLAKHKALELEIKRLLIAVVSQDIMSIVQNNFVVDTSNLQTELERTKERFENCIIKKENEYAKLWNDWYKKCEECKYDKILYDKAYNDMQQKIEQLQAQLGDQKGKCNDTPCISNTLDPLPQKLENENVELEFQIPQKVDKTHDLSNPVTSNSVPTTKESKVIDNDKVISPGMFRINPLRTRGKKILCLKNQLKQEVDITTKSRRLQPRSNIKNDRVPSAVKSSRIKNKEVEVEDHPRNLLFSKNKKHMSSECNNIKLAIWNDKFEIVCAMWSKERLASPKPSKPRMHLRCSPTGKRFDIKRKIIASSESNGEHACTPNPQEPTIKQFPNSTFFLGSSWEPFALAVCDSYLEVAFRRNICFVRNLEGVDLFKRNRTTNLYTINLHDIASASPICLMARATSTKSWLWHQRLSYLNFDTINDLARNDLVTDLPKFKYHKEHLCPSCEQGKSKRASYPPKPVPNSKQRLHLFHMDLCGSMRIASINGKQYVLVIVDDYSRYIWVVFLRLKDEAQEEIKTFPKRITVLLQAHVIIVRTDMAQNSKTKCFKNILRVLASLTKHLLSVPLNKMELWNEGTARLALCYPKNDSEDNGKLGAKGDIGFFIGYSDNSCAFRVYNQRTKKIMETMNVTFDELSAMAFEQSNLKLGLQSMTSGQISSRLDLPYAPSTITTQRPTEGELDLLFEAMHDDQIGGQPSAAPRTVQAAQAPQVLQTPTATTTTADTALTPTNSSSQTTSIPSTSQNVDELRTQQQHVQHQSATMADNVPNAMSDDNTFVNPFATPSISAAESSSLQYVDPSNMHTFYQLYPHKYQWTKDHPLEQVIGEPSQLVLTRNQL
ncbi:retrovirus-related pol polyprotein from transposon TNT 1-94 [Tanacetum coccineum]